MMGKDARARAGREERSEYASDAFARMYICLSTHAKIRELRYDTPSVYAHTSTRARGVRGMCNLSALRCVEDRDSLRWVLTLFRNPTVDLPCLQSNKKSAIFLLRRYATPDARLAFSHRGAWRRRHRERSVFLTRYGRLRDLSRVPAYLLR